MRRFHQDHSPESLRRRLFAEWLAIGLVVTLAVAVAVGVQAFARLDHVAYDLLQKASSRPADPRILIVEIDDRALSEIGAWPWPRERHAQAIETLSAAAPRAIVYDILFAEASPSDAALERAIKASGRVWLPTARGPGTHDLPFAAAEWTARGQTGSDRLYADADGVVRRTWPQDGVQIPDAPDLMHALARAQAPAATADLAEPRLIPFADPYTFDRRSFADLLDGGIAPEALRDRFVLVGVTATGLGAKVFTPKTPLGRAASGLEVQANILSGLLTRRMIAPAGLPAQLAFALAPVWLVLLVIVTAGPRRVVPLSVALAALTLGASLVLLFGLRLWISPVAPILAIPTVLLSWGWRRLAVIGDFLEGELKRLKGPSAPPRSLVQDALTGLALSLNAQITHIEAMRRFADDALFNLPDATFLLDGSGAVIAANAAAAQLARAPQEIDTHGKTIAQLLNPLGAWPPIPEAWPHGAPTAPGATFALADGRTFEPQAAEQRRNHDLWIVRLADVTALHGVQRQREQALQLLSHDMRSPHISILSLIETAGAGGLPAPTASKVANLARKALEMSEAFVRLARAESAPMRRDLLDLADIVNEAVDDLWPQSRSRHIEIRQVFAAPAAFALGERELVHRAVVNLLSNALKHGPERSVVEVRVQRVEGDGASVRIEVRDEGPGLRPEDAEAAFEPFRRLDSATPGEGVGLGLAFVRTVAQRHGGHAYALTAGSGVFVLELPAAEPKDIQDFA